MEAVQEQLDTLSSLEERITRAVQAITDLRNQNRHLQEQLGAAQSELESTRAARDEAQNVGNEFRTENSQLERKLQGANEELDQLRTERGQVRERLEKLLGQLDLLSAS